MIGIPQLRAVVGSGIAIIGLVAVGGTLISLLRDLALSKTGSFAPGTRTGQS